MGLVRISEIRWQSICLICSRNWYRQRRFRSFAPYHPCELWISLLKVTHLTVSPRSYSSNLTDLFETQERTHFWAYNIVPWFFAWMPGLYIRRVPLSTVDLMNMWITSRLYWGVLTCKIGVSPSPIYPITILLEKAGSLFKALTNASTSGQ